MQVMWDSLGEKLNSLGSWAVCVCVGGWGGGGGGFPLDETLLGIIIEIKQDHIL